MQHFGPERVQELAQLKNLLSDQPVTKIWLYRQMVYAQTRIYNGKRLVTFSRPDIGMLECSPMARETGVQSQVEL